MRYFLKINLNGNPVEQNELQHKKLQDYLPIKKIHSTTKPIFLQTFRYQTDDSGIVGANWDRPFIENDKYFLFIGGHVLNRLVIIEKTGKVVPSPEEVLRIVLDHGDSHYNYLKGNYYIILLNKKEKCITVYSSPMFLYPAFFTIQSSTLTFSDILEIVLKDTKSVEIYNRGLIEFSLFDHNIGINTIYKDVYSMTGGSRIDIKNGAFKEKTVYDIAQWIHKEPLSRKETLNKISEVLNEVIKNYISNVKTFNISLTGGFDGRLNLSIIDPAEYSRLQAFSYGKSGSLQISVPQKISRRLGFNYLPVRLDEEFAEQYAEIGRDTILLSGGLTPFTRANYLFGYGKIKDFSRNCILGQCDMIRPLYTNPAGAIFNQFSRDLFYNKSLSDFYVDYRQLAANGFLHSGFFTKEIAEQIYEEISARYISAYSSFNANEKYFLFLYKESMLKFWQTECNIVDLLVDDFISFSDLDFIEILSSSQYFGLYKGIFAANQFQRRKAHDLYIDLMTLNNNKLNNIITDRYFKPKWLKYGYLGYVIAAMGKQRAKNRAKRIGNDTFSETDWPNRFYSKFQEGINRKSDIFNVDNYNKKPYTDDNIHRFDRHISLKLWLNYLGIK